MTAPTPPLSIRLRLRAREARRAIGRATARTLLVRLLVYLPPHDLNAAVQEAHTRRTARAYRNGGPV